MLCLYLYDVCGSIWHGNVMSLSLYDHMIYIVIFDIAMLCSLSLHLSLQLMLQIKNAVWE